MIQVVIILVLLMGVGGFGGYTYVQKLQADNKVLETNNIVLESSVAEQKEAIEGLQRQAAEQQHCRGGEHKRQDKTPLLWIRSHTSSTNTS